MIGGMPVLGAEYRKALLFQQPRCLLDILYIVRPGFRHGERPPFPLSEITLEVHDQHAPFSVIGYVAYGSGRPPTAPAAEAGKSR